MVKGTEIKKKLHFRGIETWIMPIGNANIHIQINVSDFINEFVSFLSVNLIV